MPEILPDHVPSPRTLLAWDGAAYRPVAIDALGHLNVNVLTNLGLDDALQSVQTDRLIVRGEDQLHSFGGVLRVANPGKISAANGYRDSLSPGAGMIWVVTRIVAHDDTTPTTRHKYWSYHLATGVPLHQELRNFVAGELSEDSTWLHLGEDDYVKVYFAGGLANDDCNVVLHGHIMTLET